jgi:hypothetical protein
MNTGQDVGNVFRRKTVDMGHLRALNLQPTKIIALLDW